MSSGAYPLVTRIAKRNQRYRVITVWMAGVKKQQSAERASASLFLKEKKTLFFWMNSNNKSPADVEHKKYDLAFLDVPLLCLVLWKT